MGEWVKNKVKTNYATGRRELYDEWVPGYGERQCTGFRHVRFLEPAEVWPPPVAAWRPPAKPEARSKDPNELLKMKDLNSAETKILSNAIGESQAAYQEMMTGRADED